VSSDKNLLLLGRLFGVRFSYINAFGQKQTVPEDTVKSFLRSFGVNADTPDEAMRSVERARKEIRQRFAPEVKVITEGSAVSLIVTVASVDSDKELGWKLTFENKSVEEGKSSLRQLFCVRKFKFDGQEYSRLKLQLPSVLAQGYHSLDLQLAGEQHTATVQLIVAPRQCFQPQALENGQRHWGVSAQLYSLVSENSWGIGDFSDLESLANSQASRGVALIGLNPLGALPSNNAEQLSPYSPISRTELSARYISVSAIPDFQESKACAEFLQSVAFKQKLDAIKRIALVNYRLIQELKSEALELAFEHFYENHLQRQSSRAEEFEEFIELRGSLLRRFAEFEALSEFFQKQESWRWGWLSWPEEYQNCNSSAVSKFCQEHAKRVLFHQYLQWQAHLQLHNVAKQTNQVQMPLGLYLDLALGSDKSGVEVWRDKDLFVLDAEVGAPPDGYSATGQCWGFPAFQPQRLRKAGYKPFIAALRAAMRYAGVVRIDHAMSLQRLFWIPAGSDGTKGTYVRYPFQELLAIVCLESQRNRCVVIGEDLGTVPDGFRDIMYERNILSYKLLAFMRDNGNFQSIEAYPQKALVTGSTHDSPTLWGYFSGDDLRLRQEFGFIRDEHTLNSSKAEREWELDQLLHLVGVSDQRDAVLSDETFSGRKLNHQVFLAIQRFLANTSSQIMVVQLEDILEQYAPINIPGITEQYPCWRHRLTKTVNRIAADRRFSELCELLNSIRK